ncbi:MAG: hypothetical protein ROO71_08940 [Balneola sp.]
MNLDKHPLDIIYEKLCILEGTVEGASNNLRQYEKNSPVSEGLMFSFLELKESINDHLNNK